MEGFEGQTSKPFKPFQVSPADVIEVALGLVETFLLAESRNPFRDLSDRRSPGLRSVLQGDQRVDDLSSYRSIVSDQRKGLLFSTKAIERDDRMRNLANISGIGGPDGMDGRVGW